MPNASQRSSLRSRQKEQFNTKELSGDGMNDGYLNTKLPLQKHNH